MQKLSLVVPLTATNWRFYEKRSKKSSAWRGCECPRFRDSPTRVRRTIARRLIEFKCNNASRSSESIQSNRYFRFTVARGFSPVFEAKPARRRKIVLLPKRDSLSVLKLDNLGCFSTEIVILHLPNCVNGARFDQPHSTKKNFQTQQPVGCSSGKFFSSPVDDYFEIDFFFVNLEGFSRKENAWWERSVLAAAQLPQPRDLWKCFSLDFPNNKKLKYRWNFGKCLSWAVYAIFSAKIAELNRRYRNSWEHKMNLIARPLLFADWTRLRS